MALLNSPSSTAVVNVSDELVERYVAQGWKAVSEPETESEETPEEAPAPAEEEPKPKRAKARNRKKQ